MSTHVTVAPERFSFVTFDAEVIAAIVREIAERLGVSNPITIEVDETTPLSKTSAVVDGSSSDATIILRLQSGALEDTRHLTNFSESRARLSIGKLLLRSLDRMRPDFADAPEDLELTNAQNAAWNVYCGGRMDRLGYGPVKQQYRYDYRNRFGFTDDVDTRFEQLWTANDLSWHDLTS